MNFTLTNLFPDQKYRLLFFVFLFLSSYSQAQVSMRDSVLTWTHHSFELNQDGSISSWSTNDNELQEETFNAKVLENDLIRLVLVPEYGGRVISFVYKPTGHEYLYKSVNGSAYGISEGNFYYNWLMVWGGIFPTFPEPEHGKTWFLPWDYSVTKNTADTIRVQMEYTDNSAYSGAPGGFNNGITGITCRVELSIYSNSSLWDYKVTLINNQASNVNYEYWTCTTLAPGSDPDDTGTPRNSEIIVPIEQYTAGWSPGAWIGNINGTYDVSNIDYLDDWSDMGIAYSKDLNDRYWGVINHDNEEGIFRISDNIETPGMKFWTWGRNNIGNNLYDYSNGGADNYIELWAGVSNSFFTDAVMTANETKTWNEAYCATTGMTSIDNINENAAVNLTWNESTNELNYELNTFKSDEEYTLSIRLLADEDLILTEEPVSFSALGHSNSLSLDELALPFDEYTVLLELLNSSEELIVSSTEIVTAGLVTSLSDQLSDDNQLKIHVTGQNRIKLDLPDMDQYELVVMNLNGQKIMSRVFTDKTYDLEFPQNGLYIIQVVSERARYTAKLYVR